MNPWKRPVQQSRSELIATLLSHETVAADKKVAYYSEV